MTTRADVAQWMLDEIYRSQVLYQYEAVDEIERRFGSDWVYVNDNGNMAISRKVLDAFKRLHGGRVEWDNGDKSWSLV